MSEREDGNSDTDDDESFTPPCTLEDEDEEDLSFIYEGKEDVKRASHLLADICSRDLSWPSTTDQESLKRDKECLQLAERTINFEHGRPQHTRGTTLDHIIDDLGRVTFLLYPHSHLQMDTVTGDVVMNRATEMVWTEFDREAKTHMSSRKIKSLMPQLLTSFGGSVLELLGRNDIVTLQSMLCQRVMPSSVDCELKYLRQSVEPPIAGIYLGFGIDKKRRVQFVYVGKSRDISKRVLQHFAEIAKAIPDADRTSNLLYQFAKRSDTIHFEVISTVDINHPQLDYILMALEPIWCCALGSYQGQEAYNKTRERYKLPPVAIPGANSNRCLDGFQIQKSGRALECNDVELLRLERRLACSRFEWYQVRALLGYKERCATSKNQKLHSFLASFEFTTDDLERLNANHQSLSCAVEQRSALLLHSGTYPLRIWVNPDKTSFRLPQFSWRLVPLSVREAVINRVGARGLRLQLRFNGDHQVQQKVLSSSSGRQASGTVSPAALSTSFRLFPHLQENEQALYGDLRLYILHSSLDEPVSLSFSQALRYCDANVQLAQRLLDAIDFLAPGSKAKRQQKVENLKTYTIPDNVAKRDVVDAFLNGKAQARYVAGTQATFFIVSWCGTGKKKGQRLSIANGAKELYAQLNDLGMTRFAVRLTCTAARPLLWKGLDKDQRELLAFTNVELLTSRGDWIACSSTLYKKRKHDADLIQAFCDATRIIRDTMTFQELSFNTGIVPLEMPPIDLPNEPRLLKIRSVVLKKTNGTYCGVRFWANLGHNKGRELQLLIDKRVLAKLYPDGIPTDTASRTILVKLDAWHKQPDQMRLLVCKPQDGAANAWYNAVEQPLTQVAIDFVTFIS
jgi:hypothetical protein